ncbi:MAG: oligopeptidase A [Verrucomicrobia bacterium CG_4_10_14_3_um_filter_43_23]|nr:MAG: oligopeptidase A [Verrucomicrobia bacterium CG1_02_43_26]PIP59435.1 MAG: oligopeptidase A [Verrucomicrobia bacterium CG22_combo_CG10-13_8_21_14_all_43_17]PIX57638.1 MAG: oligopeptidase A [Verrucomicrobia bacterium CG_4_10_14_3_um_filter_43_23]PIY61425.1 MAG: oligopeptidase A [Verrucomicrobia bacterium CG_4_10_14_0_8_um_filter_43_34]PJA43787.1 MAG: oligopeptidase A [Verrucomicrobia bacterium CG_4_9_14_3_um_filter_43_20]
MLHPFLITSFFIPWSKMAPEHIKPDMELALLNARTKIEAITNQPLDHLTYESTLLAFEDAKEAVFRPWGFISHLDAVNNSKELRDAYNEMLPKVTEFSTQIYLNDKLWNVIRTYSETAEAKQLTGPKKRFLEETVADFIEQGANLSSSDKEKLKKINAELAEVTQKFSENVLDSTNAWEFVTDDRSMLTGLPESAIARSQEAALKKGHGSKEAPKFFFNLQAPSYVPVIQYADNEDLRKKLWAAHGDIGKKEPYDNTKLIWRTLALRHEQAQLLGNPHFPDFILKRRMAKGGENALKFVNDFHDRIESQFRNEVDALEKFKSKETHAAQEHFQPWQLAYWAEKHRKAYYDFDEESLRPYFAIDNVMAGMFQIVQRLYNISIKENKNVEAWHEDVKCYDIFDADGEHLGSFYTDWHPRDAKRGGAWMTDLITGIPGEPHLGCISGNMTPPSEGKPALLTHDEVLTIFHEFGHLLHHTLGNVPVKSLQGVQVAWDFVELPSQIMENWAWERESLDLFAKHYETGNRIPDDLFDKMTKARNHLSAIITMRQLSLGKMDMELHLHYDRFADKNLDDLVDTILATYVIPYQTKAPNITRQFGHLFSNPTGYASGYYSYKWAEVLEADAFSKFKKEGILNAKVGMEFREKVLSKGNSRPADELFSNFMGREPDMNALLERSGLL